MHDGRLIYDPPVEPWQLDDVELLRRAVKNARRSRGARYPRWNAVMEAFALGSTYSYRLCRRFGLDPDEMVKKT